MTARIRCAIYTRKSTDEGLDQSFNTLDAQREACEAYVRSQAGEGWRVLPEHYDDGGFSGGNLDRPAMQRLLADVDAGTIDVIVVYKVDRLTRSLMDFAKIVDRLDARAVSFVSVTQAFNTTTSMGRLTLNVLLSFAQFEREVTAQRIRDKIAASKAKGMWMGGNVPLGYDLGDRRLIVNFAEAEHVRHIFRRYVELRSSVKLAKELRDDGVVTKRWLSRQGKERGGIPFACGSLCYFLQNRIYLGEIVHRGTRHRGDHEPIVDPDLFDQVQAVLAANRQARRTRACGKEECVLAGLVRDGEGRELTTSFSYGRGGRLYRYYVSGSLDPSRSGSAKSAKRIPAAPLERLALRTLSDLLQRQVTFADILPLILAVELHDRSIQIAIEPSTLLEPHEPSTNAIARLQPSIDPHRVVFDENVIRVIVDRQPIFRGGRAKGGEMPETQNSGAFDLLRSAHQLLLRFSMSPLEPQAHIRAAAPAWQRRRRTMLVGLISPQIQRDIMRGTLKGSIEQLLVALPLGWGDQEEVLKQKAPRS